MKFVIGFALSLVLLISVVGYLFGETAQQWVLIFVMLVVVPIAVPTHTLKSKR